ncbi:MAG: NAD(P)H-dependent oxidoreductase [Methanoregula sp.]|nr:NAD(P)H-dependent oxidoreductase [Methanoregula sp.]
MKICIIYHSETGNTRHVAQHIASAMDAHLVEVTDTVSYNRLTRFLVLCKMARGEEKTIIKPASVDISGYELVVFGSPVWAFKPTPVIHAAIDGLQGCMGKPAVAFSTHGGRPGQTDQVFKKWIEERGMVPVAITHIHQNDIENEKKTKELIAVVKASIKAKIF